jgi:predicted branched-subunit amino acid permease
MTDTARETWRVRWRVTGREISRDPVLRDVWGACLTLGIAVGVFAIAFGVSAVAAGASVTQTCAMSLLVFTGASQLSAISVIGAAALLAARNGVYGLAMSRRLNGSLGVRLVAAQLTIDESTAMSASQTDAGRSRAAFWITGIGVYVFWNIGTLIGALAGQAIDPRTFGLDAAFPAAYVAMVWPLLADRRSAIAAALGATICLVLIPVTPVGVPILCAAVAVLIGVRR